VSTDPHGDAEIFDGFLIFLLQFLSEFWTNLKRHKVRNLSLKSFDCVKSACQVGLNC
jgi:hypothetical protein